MSIIDFSHLQQQIAESGDLPGTPTEYGGKTLRISSPRSVPDFIAPRNFYRFRWSELLTTAVTRYPHDPANASASLFRQNTVGPRRFGVQALAASLLLHLVGYAFFPKFFARFAPSSTAATLISDENKIVYYHFAKQELGGPIPRILPPGPGSMPGIASGPKRAPANGASKALGTLFAVSRPRLPDNSRQTILQHIAPPELRIKKDLRLPNIIFAEPMVPKPPLHFDANNVHPLPPTKRQYSDNAPLPSMLDTQKPVAGLLVSAISNLHLAAVGAPPVPLPASQSGEMSGDTAAPQMEASGTNGIDLVILGTDPAGSAASVALALGNRYGEFSIAPGGGSEHGSPGGREGGLPSEAGTGGNGVGGNGSTSLNGDAGLLGDPGPDPVARMVYPLPSPTGVRHNALVVSAGPMGGGGLDIYAVLPCGKIYTVFLTASGKRWSLQYCQKSESSHRSADLTRSPIVHTELPLVPPEAEEKFDFKRLPLPSEKAHKIIVLRGEIGEDGKPRNLEVFRGSASEMDAAARLAFSRWIFKPATRSGKPVCVQILLGIPADEGQTPPGS